MNGGEPHQSDPTTQPNESVAAPETGASNAPVSDPGAPADTPPAGSSGPTGETPETPASSPPAAAAPQSHAAEEKRPGSVARGQGPLAARGLGTAKPASPAVGDGGRQPAGSQGSERKGAPANKKAKPKHPRPRLAGERAATPAAEAAAGQTSAADTSAGEPPAAAAAPAAAPTPGKPARIAVPSVRGPLSADMEAELEAELAAADVESLLAGPAGMVAGRAELTEGQSVPATVLKIHEDSVFVALGGPDEGAVPFLQFAEEPSIGQSIDVIVRGFNREDGLYACMLPGQTIEVADLSDIDEGAVVEATITKTNSGGLECSVGGAEGFIPISQITEYRVEDTEEFVGQKMVCLVTQCNPRQRKLVLSRRAILEREREERRKEQLESLNVGDTVEGTVRSIKDFGAFVDLGGCDGMLHISKLSWDRIKHPSEVLENGQRVKVKIDTLDKQSGKISLSYRDLLENPWDTVEQDFPVGEVVRGTVSRIANFGAFVRLAPGIEGLVHISELAHHRVSRVENVVKEGEEVEVKVQSIDPDSQRIGLSLKAAQAAPVSKAKETAAEEVEEPQREPSVKPQHAGPLRGGTGGDSGGEKFGLRW